MSPSYLPVACTAQRCTRKQTSVIAVLSLHTASSQLVYHVLPQLFFHSQHGEHIERQPYWGHTEQPTACRLTASSEVFYIAEIIEILLFRYPGLGLGFIRSKCLIDQYFCLYKQLLGT